MATAKAPGAAKLVFDQGKLQTMVDPLTVRVERTRGNAKQSMPLPVREGYSAPGQGWTMDEVMSLEQWTVATFGGGTYTFTVTDAANPPDAMSWVQVFPTAQYPEKVPSPMVPEMVPQATMPMMSGQPSSAPMASPWPPPMPNWATPAPMAPPVNPYAFGAPMMPQYPFQFPPAWGQQQAQRPGADYRDQAEQARQQAQEERHKADLQRLTDANQRLIDEMRQQATTPKTDTALLEKLEREREERQKAERETEKARHAAELAAITARFDANTSKGPSEESVRLAKLEEDRRRDEERRRQDDQLREIREENRRREDAMMTQLTALKADQQPNFMIQMMMQQQSQQADAVKEAARLQAETQKETARLQAESARERAREQDSLLNSLRAFMMPPSDVARMVKEASSGQETFMRSMTGTFNDVFSTMRDWFQNMSQMMQGPGESPVVRLIEGGITQAKEMFERYSTGKSGVEIAQANALRAQAEAAARIQQAQMQPPPQMQQVPQQIPQNGQGWQAPPPVQQAAPAPSAGLNGAGAIPVVDGVQPVLRHGKTDEQWFGPALEGVTELRKGAAMFWESLQHQPPRMDQKTGRPAGLGPDEVAEQIIKAAAFVEKSKAANPALVEQIPAFSYLFAQQMYPQLVDIVIPDVPAGFREDAVRFIYHLLGAATGTVATAPPMSVLAGHPEFDEDDEEEDDEETT